MYPRGYLYPQGYMNPWGYMYPQGYMYPWGYMHPRGYMYPWGYIGFQGGDFTKPCLSCSQWSISPFGFVLKPVWSIHMYFNITTADSCQKSFFKTSISRNHAYRVIHSRFPPFGFCLKAHLLEQPCFTRASVGIGGPAPPRGGLEGNFSMTSSHILAWTPPECERERRPSQKVR